MKVLAHLRAGQNLFLSFPLFQASLVVEGSRCRRLSIAFSCAKKVTGA